MLSSIFFLVTLHIASGKWKILMYQVVLKSHTCCSWYLNMPFKLNCVITLWSVKLGFLWCFMHYPSSLLDQVDASQVPSKFTWACSFQVLWWRYLSYDDWFGYIREQCLLIQFAPKSSDSAPQCKRSIHEDVSVRMDPLVVDT